MAAQANRNIALTPDPESAALITECAYNKYKNYTEGYCLQVGVSLPHVTLAQFWVENPAFNDAVITRALDTLCTGMKPYRLNPVGL